MKAQQSSPRVEESDLEESDQQESPKLKVDTTKQKDQRLERLAAKLARVEEKKHCPQFIEAYFKSDGGVDYHG